MTEYRRLEHIAAATAVSESVGYLVAGIRHEIGNPLNSIKAALTLLADQTVALPEERRWDFMARTQAEVRRIESLLEQMRTFNMHEEVRLARVELRPFLERFVRLAEPDCGARSIELALLPGPSPVVTADARLVQQALLLLLANAIDALRDSPRRRIELGCSSARHLARITLSDTGRGMSAEQLENALRPFVTSKHNGTGLGLPLANRYATLTSASLRIASEPGVGTRCTLEFEAPNMSPPRSN